MDENKVAAAAVAAGLAVSALSGGFTTGSSLQEQAAEVQSSQQETRRNEGNETGNDVRKESDAPGERR